MADSTQMGRHELAGIWPGVWEPLKHLGEKVAGFFTPAADAATTDETYELSIELPGVAAEDVVIELHDHILSVKGEKHTHREKTGKSFYFSERRYGSFHRAFRLPENVQEDDVKAAFKDGVLTIAIPKASAHRKPAARIPIHS